MSFVVPEGLVVFSKSNCPACEELKAKLKEQETEYVEVKIDTKPEARDFIISKGFRSMPVVFKDGNSVSVYEVVQ